MSMGRRVWPLERILGSQRLVVEVDRTVVVAVGREEKDLVEKDRSPAEDEGKRRSGGEHAWVRAKDDAKAAAMLTGNAFFGLLRPFPPSSSPQPRRSIGGAHVFSKSDLLIYT